jgi:tRNA threonylcarbamoyl adenosine modification protein (Sua5/YciO/YrdC/YwlC family)
MSPSDAPDLAGIAASLALGLPVVIPTDTVYGLALLVSDSTDPEILFKVKGRPAEKAIPWLVASQDDLLRYTSELPDWAWQMAGRHWPGALTLVARASAAAPPAFVAADGTLALRMPGHRLALELLSLAAAPLATTSANISGQPPVSLAADIDPLVLKQVAGLLVDPDERPGRAAIPSTVVSCLGDHPVILRQGALGIAELLTD